MKKHSVFQLLFAIFFALALSPHAVFAQAVEVTEETAVEGSPRSSAPRAPQTGPEAARKYFNSRSAPTPNVERAPAAVSGDRYLAIHLGTFVSEDSYKWGGGGKKDVGQVNGGVTYKMGEWKGSMDLMFKADLTSYKLAEGRATKLSVMPAISFPDVESGFPLYFGAGAGLGVFFKQIEDESSLSFDYSLFAGARFFELLNNVGVIFETGVKNHILLLSDGQFNGVYVSLGAVFTF